MMSSPYPFGESSQPTDYVNADLSYTSSEGSLHHPLTPISFNCNMSAAPAGHSLITDSTGMMRLHEQLREVQRRLDRERSARLSLENRRKAFEREKATLIQKLHDATVEKSALEQTKIELESRMRSAEYNLNQASEKIKDSERLHSRMKEMLFKKENQYAKESEAKQRLELTIGNTQMEMQIAHASIKQLQDERNSLSSQLQHEKASCSLQERVNADQKHARTQEAQQTASVVVCLQQELTAATKKLEMNEARRNSEFHEMKLELDRAKVLQETEHTMFTAENSELHSKLQQAKNAAKLNQDALTYASMNYIKETKALTSANTKLTASLEQETLCKQNLQAALTELECLYKATVSDLEQTKKERNDLESSYREAMGISRHRLELEGQELSHAKHDIQKYILRLSEADDRACKLENELLITSSALVERSNELAVLQKENFRAEMEEQVRLQSQVESMQEKVLFLQNENVALKNALEECEKVACKAQNEIVGVKHDHDKLKSSLENDIHRLLASVTQAKEEVRDAACCRVSTNQRIQQLEGTVAETKQRLALCDTEKDDLRKNCEKLEEEKRSSVIQLETANRLHTESEVRLTHLSQNNADLISQRDELSQLKKSLEEEVGRVKSEKNELKHEAKRGKKQTKENEKFQKECESLKALVSEMKCANKLLEEKVADAWRMHKKENATAEKTRNMLLNEETVSSELHLQVSELERTNQVTTAQLEEEKRNVIRLMEMKKAAEMKAEYNQEIMRQLKKENDTQRGQLEVARNTLLSEETREDLSEMERRLKCELEEKGRRELSTKLADVNVFLDEQARARDRLDAMRDANEADQQRKFTILQHNWQDEMEKLEASLKELKAHQQCKDAEAQRYKELYEAEQRIHARSNSRHGNDHPIRMQACERSQFGHQTFGGLSGQTENKLTWPLLKHNSSHGGCLDQLVKEALDRSIKKHLEKGPQIDISVPVRTVDEKGVTTSLRKCNSEFLLAQNKK